jgi:phosphoribosyl-ATP pyrophosphohydrolase/phosphoribosyl-AMP cyclohydrolase
MNLDSVRWDAQGLAPVIIADATSGDVLTLAYANREALERTVATGSTWLWSRSRAELWNKGATSGNTQHVLEVRLDCDGDALLYRVHPNGPACHTGAMSCFNVTLSLTKGSETTLPSAPRQARGDSAGGDTFANAVIELANTIAERKRTAPPDSYTAKLFAGGVDRIGKKIGEEAVEVVIAAKNADPAELVWETADLLYHTLVLLAERGVSLDAVGAELSRRAQLTD